MRKKFSPNAKFLQKNETNTKSSFKKQKQKKEKNTCSNLGITEILGINDIHTLNQIYLHRQYWGFYITYIDDIIFIEKEFSTHTKI